MVSETPTSSTRTQRERICRAFALTVLAAVVVAPRAQAGTGGANVVINPLVKDVKCAKACARRKAVQVGSTIRIKGAELAAASQILFLGGSGPDDDVPGGIVAARNRSLLAKVPGNASSGPVVVLTSAGGRSKPTEPLAVLPRPPVIGSPDLKPVDGISASSGTTLETGTSTPRVVFLGAKALVRFSLRATGAGEAATATVNLIREADGQTVRTWAVPAPEGQIVSIDWDGTAGGAAQPPGRYAFRTTVGDPQGAVLSTASVNADRDAFDLYGFMFPIRGAHNFGEKMARFGAGRPGHRHQGQDVMSPCGTTLVAARGGTVIKNASHSAAGNYVVIRSDFGAGDHAYMHMKARSPFVVGDRVYTGQPIGLVGNTGRSSACHLHFEIWSAPGWYQGGRPRDPLADLMAWDTVS